MEERIITQVTPRVFRSPASARFAAWLEDGIMVKEADGFHVLSRQMTGSKMQDLVQKGNYGLIKDIADQLAGQGSVDFDFKGVVSRSFRLPFRSFAKTACYALTKGSTTSRLLRGALLTSTRKAIEKAGFSRGKLKLLLGAIQETGSLQDADTSAYSRDEYQIPAPTYLASSGWLEIAQLFWEELSSRFRSKLALVSDDQLNAWGSNLVLSWTDFFETSGGPFDFAIRKEGEGLVLEFGIFFLLCSLEPEEIDQIGLSPDQVKELDAALRPFITSGSNVEDEDFAVGLALRTWAIQQHETSLSLDGIEASAEKLAKERDDLSEGLSTSIRMLDQNLIAAIASNDLQKISKVSEKLAKMKRDLRWDGLAYDSLVALYEGKPCVVSFTASELLFQMMPYAEISIDNLVEYATRRA